MCSAEPLPSGFLGVKGDSHYAHSGMLKSSLSLATKLYPMILSLLNNPRYASYPLILTGHSLGAGAAALLTSIFLSTSTYPKLSLPVSHHARLKCYGYGTPAILTEPLCDALKPYCHSVVIGEERRLERSDSKIIIPHSYTIKNLPLVASLLAIGTLGLDMVPKFSLRSFRILRDSVLDELSSSKGVRSRGGESEKASDMPVLLPAGKIVWLDEGKEGNPAFLKDCKVGAGATEATPNAKAMYCLPSTDKLPSCITNNPSRAHLKDFDYMGVSNSSFASHMPQNYYVLVKDRWIR